METLQPKLKFLFNLSKTRVRGLIYVALVATAATLISLKLQPWIQLESLTIAIVLGMILSNTFKTPKALAPGIDYALKTLLIYGIVLLGFKLNFKAISQLGLPLLLGIISYMLFVFLMVFILNKWFKVSTKLMTLIAVGSSICGAAAVVALAPTIDATEEDTVLAVSIVSFLGAIGVIIYAIVANSIPISDISYGIWAGLTLHGVAHALAGAFARGAISGEIGTFVKMTRVLMLVPVSLALSMVFHQKGGLKKRAHVPPYLWGFILAGLIHATGLVPPLVTNLAQQTSQYFILFSMTAMGLTVNFKDIAGRGLKSVALGITLFTITATLTFFALI